MESSCQLTQLKIGGSQALAIAGVRIRSVADTTAAVGLGYIPATAFRLARSSEDCNVCVFSPLITHKIAVDKGQAVVEAEAGFHRRHTGVVGATV